MEDDKLSGIRLSDIYGYSDKSYNDHINNNIDRLNSIHEEYPDYNFDLLKAHSYLNSLIRKKVGDNKFESDFADIEDFDEKTRKYNELFNDKYNPIDTIKENLSPFADVASGIVNALPAVGMTKDAIRKYKNNKGVEISDAQKDEVFSNGDIPIWNVKIDDVGNRLTMHGYFKMYNPKEADEHESYVGQSELTKKINDEVVAKKLYNDKYRRISSDDEYDTSRVQGQIDEYTKEIRQKLDDDKVLNLDYYNEFEKQMNSISNDFRDYNDSEMMNISPNQMKDIMSRYYAIASIGGLDKANEFAIKTFRNIASENQGYLRKLANGINSAVTNLTGDMMSFTGIVGSAIPGIILASSKNHEIDDASWVSEALYYASQNALTERGNDIIKYGSFSPSRIAERKKSGTNSYQVIRNYGEETDFWNSNTPFDILPQSAFTLGAMLTGTGFSRLLSNTLGIGTRRTASKLMKNNLSAMRRGLGKVISVADDAFTVGSTALMTAATEASIDANEVYDTIKSAQLRAVDDRVNGLVREDINNGKFEEWLYEKYPFFEALKDEKIDPKQKEYLYQRLQQIQDKELKEYYNIKREEYLNDNDLKDAIEDEATRAAMKNMFDETMFIAFGDALFTKILGPTVKNARRSIFRNLKGMGSDFDISRNAAGQIRVTAPKRNAFSKYVLPGAKGLFESLEEGIEEQFQNVDTQLRIDLADDYIAQWINARHDPNQINDLSDNLRSNRDVAAASLKRNILSDESIYSFLMGAVSAGLGQPTIVNGIRSSRIAKESGIKRSAAERFFSYVRNPIYESIKDAENDYNKLKAEADDVNRWLENHPDVAGMKDLTSVLSWAEKQMAAGYDNNEMDYRDALMGQKVATLMMMDRIAGTAKEQSFYKKFRLLSNMSYGTEEANQLIDQALNIRGIQNATEEERKEVFDDIKKKAKDIIDLQNRIHSTRNWVKSRHGDILSPESIDAMTFQYIMLNDEEQRISDISKDVKNAWNASIKLDDYKAHTAVSTSSEEKEAIAKYGTKENAKEEREIIEKALAGFRANSKELKARNGVFVYKSKERALVKDLRDIDKAIEILDNVHSYDDEGNQTTPVVKAEEIAALSLSAMAQIIDERNKKNYSKEQKEEIDRFLASDGITEEILKSITDGAKLEQRHKEFSRRTKELEASPKTAVLYDNDIRRRAALKYAEIGLAKAIKAENYDDFKNAVDEFSDDPFYGSFADFIPQVLRSNPFFKDYIKELNTRNSAMSVMENSLLYKELSDKEKELFRYAYYKAVSDGDTSFNNIYKYMSDPEAIKRLEATPDILTNEFSSKISNILTQINNYENVQKSVDDYFKKLNSKSGGKSKAAAKTGNTKRETLLNKGYYDRSKDIIDNLVARLTNFLTERINSDKLIKENIVLLANLFSDNEIFNDFLVKDIELDLSEKGILELSNTLSTALDNAAYNNPDAANTDQYKNTILLRNALNSILALYKSAKENYQTRNLKTFLSNALIDLNPSFRLKLKSVNEKDRIKHVDPEIKLAKDLKYEAEKDYLEEHNIKQNRDVLSKIYNSKGVNDPINAVYIYDRELSQKILAESGETEFTIDNLPIVVAAIVKEGTEGAQLVNGLYVLPIGILNESRLIPAIERENTMNQIRSLALDANVYGLIKNLDGTLYKTKGINVVQKTEAVGSEGSLRDMLIAKHNGNKAEALDDFKNNIVKVELGRQNLDSKEITGVYSYNGKDYTFSYMIKDGTWKNRTQHSMSAYIDPSNPTKPILLHVKEMSDDPTDMSDLYQLLSSNEDITARNIDSDKADVAAISNGVKAVRNVIQKYIKYLKKDGEREDINKIAANGLNKYINYGRTKTSNKDPYNFEIRAIKSDNGYRLSIKIFGKSIIQDNDFVVDFGSIQFKDIPDEKELDLLIQRGLRDLIFEDETKLRPTERTAGTERETPLVKIQVNEDMVRSHDNVKNIKDLNRRENYKKSIFESNIYEMTGKISVDVSEIKLNDTNQNEVSNSGKLIDDAKKDIATYIVTDDDRRASNESRVPGAMGVTTFISDDSDVRDFSTQDKVAMSLGTSFDKLVRIYYQTGKSIDGIKKWMSDNKIGQSWLGFGTPGTSSEFMKMFNEIKKLDKFFEDRHEQVLTHDYRFAGRVELSDGLYQNFIAEPDIVTIDQYGKYHIYDMKSVKYNALAQLSAKEGFNNPLGLIFDGISKSDANINKWTEQLSLYKRLIEDCLGKDRVASIGIIPIVFDYNVTSDVTIDETSPIPESFGRNLFSITMDGKDTDENGNKKKVAFRINEKNSYLFTDAIKLKPITDLSKISPGKWLINTGGESIADMIKKSANSEEAVEAKIEATVPLSPIKRRTKKTPISQITADLRSLRNPNISDFKDQQECG